MRVFIYLFAIWTSLFLAAAFSQQPIEYVGHPNYHDITMSPDGKNYAVLSVAPKTGIQPAAWHQIISKKVATKSVIVHHKPENRFYFSINWVRDDAIIAYGRKFKIKKRSAASQDVLYLINPLTGTEKELFSTTKVSVKKDAKTFSMRGYSSTTNEFAFSFRKSSSEELWAVNIDTGETRLLDKGPKSTLNWVINEKSEPIVRIEKRKYDHIRDYLEKNNKGKWETFSTINHLQDQFAGLSIDVDNLFMTVLTRPSGAETSGLYKYDLETRKTEKIYAHPEFDAVNVGKTSFGGKILYVSWIDDVVEKHWLNPALKPTGDSLSRALGQNNSWSIAETSKDNKTWMIYANSPTNRGTYYIWDTQNNKLHDLDNYLTQISQNLLSQPRRIDYQAKDGLKLSGYFTPLKFSTADSKLVVIPHGGPVSRDKIGWHGWAQYLSKQGYAVWQPNFRGSGGFGKAFEYAGHNEWGQKMQTDIEDGVDYLVSRGLVDRNNDRAIVGASYGGYAALAAATLTPEKYKCVISINGVSDPAGLINHYNTKDPYDKFVRDVWIRRIGNPDTEGAALKRISPLHNLENITAQIMLIHGAQDSIVPVEQSQMFYDKAKAMGLPVSFGILKNVGHGYWSEYVDTKMLTDIDTFLVSCMD